MSDQPFDIVAIGGGTAGLVTAAGAAGLGARAALIERDRLGGDCLWTGCVPSKALIASARIAQHMRSAGRYGLRPVEPDVDGRSVLESVRRARGIVAHHDDPERFRDMGVEVLLGETARFVSSHEVLVGDRRIRGRRFVIATGSRPVVPPIEGLEETGYFTHEDAFDREDLPESVAILGGGAIGIEFAQAYRRLGVDVTVIEVADGILGTEEPELVELLQARLEEEGVILHTGVRVSRVRRDRETGRAVLTLAAEAENGVTLGEVRAAEVLVAAGRAPNTEQLGLEAIGVRTEKGRVLVDEKLRTSIPHIFAAGDVTGAFQFTHAADQDARVVIQNALFPVRTRIDRSVMPWAIFTEPPLAHVGRTEAQARERWGDEVETAVYDVGDLDRAIADREAYGRVKLIVRKGKLAGGHILAPAAGTMIVELAMAMKQGAGPPVLSNLVHPYPTMSEGVRRAADAYRRTTFTGWKKKAVEVALTVGRYRPA